jgi:thiosulfate dehydrogenase
MGTKEIRSRHTPDPKAGSKVYETHCAMCHGKDGGGQERPDGLSYPPLWGENSFNDAAGMNQPATFAYFVYENMPYGDPGLTIEEALDVAAFVTSQPRPQFKGD